MSTFDKVSDQYAKKSLVQANAAVKLMNLLNINNNDSILDVACGPGNLTKELQNLTRGSVVGTDISQGMIEKARQKYPEIEFVQVAAENINYTDKFDIVFCNSSFQWFKKPELAVKAMYKALKPNGRAAIACPGTKQWSPCFIEVIEKVSKDSAIEPVFKHWQNPWTFLDTENDYKKLFENTGFKTQYLSVDYEKNWFSLEEGYGVYISGAANGFTKKEYYSVSADEDFIKRFNNKVKEEFEKKLVNGKFCLDFNRFYYIGSKT